MAYAAGDIINFPYTGAAQAVTLPPGLYKLEVWGAQGGHRSTTYGTGGKGGYSVGRLSINEETTLIAQVGGAGSYVTGSTAGGAGYNGGGTSKYYGGGGGGATDFRIGQDSLYARVIVAGGGGGAQGRGSSSYKASGGAGGGTNGQTGGYYGTDVEASSGGPGGTQTAAGGVVNSSYGNTAGSFGTGGNGDYRSSTYCGVGAGGGGWYGGGTGYYRYAGGGGGSGFVWTGANAPDGYLLGAEYYLTSAATTAGSESFTGPDGASETGHSGDGYARITVLEIYPQVPDAPGNFRQTGKTYYTISLAWDTVPDASGYKLYKDGALISTQTATTYTDAGMLPAERHTYTLTAYNADGESDPAELTAETEFAYYVVRPVFHSASFSVNPADMNQSTVLTVQVTDEFKILEPDYCYSGEVYSGEV